ncbi:hypothetical protein KC343_g11666 [Hortaea werneckii]|nr:hypothetical protein KC323_g4688 [Hortaea werneckii]KAI6868579.1 hypothetical protein KC338_g3907 [Hortaea werneckii]KAI7354797.1 hypothetical protein KC320_g3223 [Hortaea werneckii]KAI7563581.1 hypothetical protein KC317_g7634 [Hortaea werneckii]KAI7611144.1 hypothetical protein KC343_g11666 [Hortaea werneckii]
MDRYNHSAPRGPQIHAVPDNERAYDASGRRLPWGYDTITSVNFGEGERTSREPIEKGPFGRRNTRPGRGSSRSRSKTAEPERKEDIAKREQLQAEEAVFGTLSRKAGGRDREALSEVEPNAVAQQSTAPSAPKIEGEQEATEVMLWGFGDELQWAAIDFYERASGGVILEDYDRTSSEQRGYDAVTRSYSRAAAQKSLGKAALRKKNKYAGGNHWIKVTFDSREAAELACARSPHQVRGYLVSAEPWIGRGPARDDAVPATNAGTRTRGVALPPSSSTQTVSPDSSRTVSSQTEQQTPPHQPRRRARDEKRDAPPQWQQPAAPLARASSGFELAEHRPQQNQQQQQVTHRRTGTRGRIEGAKFVSALPAEVALMPKQPKQSWTAWLGASEVIGTTVPRKEDGTFDYDRASLYWRLFYWVDWLLGTDWCGLRTDE